MKYSGHFGPLVRFEIISCRQGSLSMWRGFIASHVLPSQTWKNRTISHHIASHFPHDRTLPILRPKVIVKILSSLSIMKQSIFFNDLLSLRSFETEFLLVSFVPYTLTSFFALILVFTLYAFDLNIAIFLLWKNVIQFSNLKWMPNYSVIKSFGSAMIGGSLRQFQQFLPFL